MTKPWLKFYPADWRADPRLRMCSLAARGLWIDLMSYMHEGEPYGHLTIDGVPPPTSGISALVGRPLNEVIKALAELEARNVFDRAPNGAIVSRRMVRDHDRSEEGREHIARRWPDRVPNRSPNSMDDRGASDEPFTQKLEARSQSPERKKEGARARASYSVEFEDQFWKPYPRTPVMSKAEAWKAWLEASEEERGKIVAAVPRYAAWLRGKPEHPAVHACRFISQRRHEGFAETQDAQPVTLILIAPQTPEWQAWWDYYDGKRNSAGASFGITRMRRARADGQPHHERSRWPPGFVPPDGGAA
jgi:hypothetical protein